MPASIVRRGMALAAMTTALILAGCGGVPLSSPSASSPSSSTQVAQSTPARTGSVPVLPPAGSGKGGYYMDDGPGDAPPEGLLDTPDAEPKIEPYSRTGNRPYVVFGKRYVPFTDDRPFKQRGIGSWYGKKFHGQKTSSGELYDMYKMTAAHPTLPIPSYARVTNLSNGKQVIVRVNDRGPFHSGRIIDLSYTAALKLGYLGSGSAQLEVERLLPDEIQRMAAAKRDAQAMAVTVAQQDDAVPQVQTVALSMTAPPERTPLATPAPILAAQPPMPGFYLQLGSFSQPANAEAMRAQAMQDASLALPAVEIVESGALFKVLSGPFASREEAALVAQRLQDAGKGKVMIVQR